MPLTTNDRPVRGARGPSRAASAEAGFALIEVLVSALIVVIIAVGAFTALEATGRAGAEQRHRAQAHGVAQDDQARLRALKISDLSNLVETATVTEGGSSYTVDSEGQYVTDSTGTATCTETDASADYLRITSTVSWPSMGSRPPVVLSSIVAPPSGSISPDAGTLAVAVQNAQATGVAGVDMSGTGPASFNGSTNSNGCVIFGNLPAGNYTLTPSATGLVDKDGDAPEPQTVGVVASSTNTLALQYDEPGAIQVSFTTKVGANLPPSSADTVVVFNTGMTAAETFGTVGSPAATLPATPLFPFASPDTVYAGSCTGNNPNPTNLPDPPGAAALDNVVVPAGGIVAAQVQLPALHLTVYSGTGASSPGVPVAGATVTISDTKCAGAGGAPVKRTFTTNAQGKLDDPGLPWSVYNLCADNGTQRRTANSVTVQNLTSGTTRALYLGGGTAGTCP